MKEKIIIIIVVLLMLLTFTTMTIGKSVEDNSDIIDININKSIIINNPFFRNCFKLKFLKSGKKIILFISFDVTK